MVRTRIAPSPTGSPHIGTIFQALVNYLIARKHQGSFVVRIEDTDQVRKVDGAEDELLDALDYFGLIPDESTRHVGDYGPYRQSERLDLYASHVNTLLDAGHAYYCFCKPERLDRVRKEMQKIGKPPMYDKHCRTIDPQESAQRAENESHVVRMKVPDGQTIVVQDALRSDITFESAVVDDQVLIKSDGFPTYHLAVVVDDHLMKISHTVRGEEWISSAPKHVLLYRFLNWDPPIFIHTPLLRNPDKSKLSKRHSHTSVSWYRDKGYLPEAVLNFLLTRVWNHPQGKEIFSLEEAVSLFDVSDMHIQGPVVDLDKLDWINSQWIRSLDIQELKSKIRPYMQLDLDDALLDKILPLIHERLIVLSEINSLAYYFERSPKVEESLVLRHSKMSLEDTRSYLGRVVEVLDKIDWRSQILESELRTLQEQMQLKPRAAFMTLRVALTNETKTPPLFDVMEVLGRQEVVARLKAL